MKTQIDFMTQRYPGRRKHTQISPIIMTINIVVIIIMTNNNNMIMIMVTTMVMIIMTINNIIITMVMIIMRDERGRSVCWQLVAGNGRHPSCQA